MGSYKYLKSSGCIYTRRYVAVAMLYSDVGLVGKKHDAAATLL